MTGSGAKRCEPSGLTSLFGVPYNPTVRPRGCSSVVERLLPKQDIVGSSPITRSEAEDSIPGFLLCYTYL